MDMNMRSLCAVVSLSVVGGALGQPLEGGGYLDLDGVNDVVSAEGDFLSQTMTVELWIKPRLVHELWTAGMVTYGSRDLSSFNFGIGPENDTRLRFFINYNQGQQTIVGTQPIEMGAWQHVAVTYDGETARLYINGELDAEEVLGEAILPSDPEALLAIGDDYPGSSEYLAGLFDEVRVWGVVRSESEIVDTMFVPLTGEEEGLLAYYDFDECGSQVVLDRSPNAHHGRLGLSWSRDKHDPDRMVYVPSRRRCLSVTSSDMLMEMYPIDGSLNSQRVQINAGPPMAGWSPVVNRHEDLHVRDSFVCDPGNLYRAFVDSESYLDDVDEVTRDNCGSAFYMILFKMPPIVENTAVYGVANADDLAVAFLNHRPISLLLTADDIANVGTDRVFNGHPLLGWPTADPFFEESVADLVGPGTNSIAFGVHSDASPMEPAGLEFEMVVQYDCLADWNADGVWNTLDYTAFLNDWTSQEPEADLNQDGRINTQDIMVWLNLWNFGCPE